MASSLPRPKLNHDACSHCCARRSPGTGWFWAKNRSFCLAEAVRGKTMMVRRGQYPHQPLTTRQGITLFEVVLALAIFIGALAAIGQILRTGSQAAVRGQLAADAILRCERRMNEVIAGVLPLQSTSQSPFEDDPGWTWSLNVTDSTIPYLLQIEVTVERAGTRSESTAMASLVRLMRDPQIYYDASLGPGVLP